MTQSTLKPRQAPSAMCQVLGLVPSPGISSCGNADRHSTHPSLNELFLWEQTGILSDKSVKGLDWEFSGLSQSWHVPHSKRTDWADRIRGSARISVHTGWRKLEKSVMSLQLLMAGVTVELTAQSNVLMFSMVCLRSHSRKACPHSGPPAEAHAGVSEPPF